MRKDGRSEWAWRRDQFWTLYRVFLTRLVDLELLSQEADTTRLLAQFLTIFSFFSAVCALPALLVAGMPQETARWPEHFLLATTMLVASSVSVMTWDAALPDGRDALVLAPLPVRLSTLFAAKVSALISAPALAVVSLNVFTGLAWPLVFGDHHAGLLRGLRAWPAYWAATAAAGLFPFCLMLGLHGFLANLLPRQLFQRLSAFLQAGILCGLLCMYLLEPALESTNALLEPGNQAKLAWMPTYWFLGLLQQMNGTMRPEFVPLARRAWLGLWASVVSAGCGLMLAYVRMLPKIVEEPGIIPVVRGLTPPEWMRGGLRLALVLFSLRTVMRSRQHRMILSFYLGIGLAIVVAFGKTSGKAAIPGASGIPATALLAGVLMMLLAVLSLRVVVAMPIALKANWMVQMTQVAPARAYRRAVRLSWLLLAVVPVLVLAAGAYLPAYPRGSVGKHLLLLFMLGVITVEICLLTFPKVPFTCAYLPGKANLHFVFWVGVSISLFLLRRVAAWEERVLQMPLGFMGLVTGLAAVAGGLAMTSEIRARATDRLVFEETYGEEMVTLDLR